MESNTTTIHQHTVPDHHQARNGALMMNDEDLERSQKQEETGIVDPRADTTIMDPAEIEAQGSAMEGDPYDGLS